MLKKWMILPIAAGFLAVNAGAACTETVKIGSIKQLNDFRKRVNDGNPGLCAELTNDIVYDTDVVAGDKSKLNDGKVENWTPIGSDANKYTGVFDGKGFAISGLVVTTVAWEPSFISISGNGAVIQNLNIRDSYFAPTGNSRNNYTGGAAAIIGAVKEGVATIKNCSFDGLIYGGKDNGGLVGSVKKGTTLNLIDSYSVAKVNAPGGDVGGLVGYVEGGTLNIKNCYSAGSATNNPLVGGKANGSQVSGENVGCLSSASKCTSVVTSGVTQGDSATLALNYLNNKSGASDITSEWSKLSNEQKIERLNENVEGIDVELVQTTEGKWIPRTKIKTQMDLSEKNALIIKDDVVADSLTFDREFTAGVASTIMVPFNYSVNSAMKAKFYEFTDIAQNAEGAWKVYAKQVTVLQAHTPYMVVPTASGELTFVGPFVLWTNNNGGAYEKSIGSTAWKAVGVYTKKRWDVDENEEEIGKIYGFAAQAKSEKNPGDFVRGGKKVAVLPMRSYLKYDASTDEESVVSTPTLTKMRAISSTEIASIEALPQRIEVELEDIPERVESIDVPSISEEGGIQEGQDDVLGITKNPVIRLDNQKANRWFNVNGRNMNVKPKSQGAFIKNSTPVIVK